MMLIEPRHLALLAFPTLINAVALSDMTPRATGLPPMCNAVYTSQIYGCSPSDFTSQQCSPTCISALYGLVQAIQHACGNQGIEGQNLVVAFLAGVGPQQLCHNAEPGGETTSAAPSTTAQHHSTKPEPSIISSTTTAHKPTDTKTSLLVDTSSTMTETMIPHKTQKQHHTSPTTHSTSGAASSTSALPVHTTNSPSPTLSTKTSAAAGSSQTDVDDHSGGGSPFDTSGNLMNSASSFTIPASPLALLAAAGLWAVFR